MNKYANFVSNQIKNSLKSLQASLNNSNNSTSHHNTCSTQTKRVYFERVWANHKDSS